MSPAQLLAVVEVPRGDRVRCQAEGCHHVVFRRIHVVREDSVIRVYGSECFKKRFGDASVTSPSPHYTSSDGRHLTEEERRLLIENTERLIEQWEAEYQAALARKATTTAPREPTAFPSTPASEPPEAHNCVLTREAAVAQAKEELRAKHGVNPELPGWHGYVQSLADRILRENAR